MPELKEQKCVPCTGATPVISVDEAKKNLSQLQPGWQLEANIKIWKLFKFKDFKGSIAFVNKLAEVAEQQGHHPDIKINWNRVTIELSTHAIKGLSQNDFILATKIDALV